MQCDALTANFGPQNTSAFYVITRLLFVIRSVFCTQII